MCGFDQRCVVGRLETYYRRIESEAGGDWDAMEAVLARRMNASAFNGRRDYRPDGHLDRNEVDFIVQDSRAASPGLFYGPIRDRIWDALDQNRDGRVTRAEMQRIAERYGNGSRG